MQQQELRKQSRAAFGALLAVAIVQTLGATLVAFAGREMVQQSIPHQPGQIVVVDEQVLRIMQVVLFGIAGAFFALAFWARRNPLPAAIVGLLMFVSLHATEAVIDPNSIPKGIVMKVIVIVVLIKAISAGIKYNKMRRELAVGG